MPLSRAIVTTRHGQRKRLVKHSSVLGEPSDPPLSLGGLEDATELGKALRARYVWPGCEPTGTCLGTREEVQGDVRAESSGLARTLSTAQGLLAALFPSGADAQVPTPIYSRADKQDAMLRSYSKCPTHSARIARWHESAEFKARENETEPLRARVGGALEAVLPPKNLPSPAGAPTPLRDWYNAFDVLDVLLATNASANASAQLRELLAPSAALAAWVESRKFGLTLARNSCGSALLRAVASAARGDSARLQLYVAHYPTMICALSALGIAVDSADSTDAWIGTSLPPTGSALALEVKAGAAGEGEAVEDVELWFWQRGSGPLEPGWTRLALPCPPAGRLDACPLPYFLRLIDDVTLGSDDAWCRACENTELGVCQAWRTEDAAAAAAAGTVPIAAAAALGALCASLGALLFFAVFALLLLLHVTRRQRGKPELSQLDMGSRSPR